MADLNENETTLELMTEMTESEVTQNDPTYQNTKMYAQRGTDASSDRKVKLSTLVSLIQKALTRVFIKVGSDSTTITENEVKISGTASQSVLNLDGMNITDGTDTAKVKCDEFKIGRTTLYTTIDREGLFASKVQVTNVNATTVNATNVKIGEEYIRSNDNGTISFQNEDGSVAPIEASSSTFSKLKTEQLNVNNKLVVTSTSGKFIGDFTFKSGTLKTEYVEATQGKVTDLNASSIKVQTLINLPIVLAYPSSPKAGDIVVFKAAEGVYAFQLYTDAGTWIKI